MAQSEWLRFVEKNEQQRRRAAVSLGRVAGVSVGTALAARTLAHLPPLFSCAARVCCL